jgi:ferredoxin/flavodoxin---NADP+ reductase
LRDRPKVFTLRLVAMSKPGAVRAPAPMRAAPPSAAPGTVLERIPITPSLLVLRIARPPGLDFAPGQNVRVGVSGATHPYTIASAPEDPYLEFCIELVPNGRLTPRLFALRPGERASVGTRAKGSLVLDEGVSDHLMFATVTGVAPFISMLRRERRALRPGRRILLVHGASSSAELVYRNELEDLARALPGFTYVPALSQPEAGWSGERGRLPSISAAWAERFDLVPGHCRVYACGNPAMVEAISAQFESAAVPVSTESFWRV